MRTPAQKRRLALRRAGIIGPDRRDFCEGLMFEGRWYTPIEMKAAAVMRMTWVDAQMKSVRNYINRHNELPDGPLARRVKLAP